MRSFLVAALALSSAVLAEGGQAQVGRLDQLSWMAGCWRLDADGRTIEEMWMAPAGGLMLGTSRTIVKGAAVAYEFMQVRERDGKLAFVAAPSNQAETAFPLVRSVGQEAVFENPAHDFPQRVIYRRSGDRLTGSIEGMQDGKERSASFPMERVRCP